MNQISQKDVNNQKTVSDSNNSLASQDTEVRFCEKHEAGANEEKVCCDGEIEKTDVIEDADKYLLDTTATTSDMKVEPYLNEQNSDTLEEDLVLKWDEDDLDIEEDSAIQTISSEPDKTNDKENDSDDIVFEKKFIKHEDFVPVHNESHDQSTEQNRQETSPLNDKANSTNSPSKLVTVTHFFESLKQPPDENSVLIEKHEDIVPSENFKSTDDEVTGAEYPNQIHNSNVKIEDENISVKSEVITRQDQTSDNTEGIITLSAPDYDISVDNSDIVLNTNHQLCKPDVILEIPSEESKMDIADFIKNNREITLSAMAEERIAKSMFSNLNISTVEDNDGSSPNSCKPKILVNSQNNNNKDLINESEKVTTETSLVTDSDLQNIKDLDVNNCAEKQVRNRNYSTIEEKSTKIDGDLKSTNKELITQTIEDITKTEFDSQPSTSLKRFELEDELSENTDSLGLLAESSRVMDDDEDLDEDDDVDDGEEEDFDPDDESSNQMTAEHSEDSNAPQSELETPKELVVTKTNNSVTENEAIQTKPFMEKRDLKSYQEDTNKNVTNITLKKDEIDNQETGSLQTKVIEDKVKSPQKIQILKVKDITNSIEAVDCESQLRIENVMSEVPQLSEGAVMEVDDIELDKAADVTKILEKDVDESETPLFEEEMDGGVGKTIVNRTERTESIEISTKETAEIEISTEETQPMETVEIQPVQHQLDTDILQPSTETSETQVQKSSLLKDLLEKTLSSVPEITSPVRKKGKRSPKEVVDEVISCSINLESSSEDEMQDVLKSKVAEPDPEEMTSVNIPNDIEIMSSGAKTCDIQTKEGEVVISGVPKAKPPHKPARLNTSEVTIKTTSTPSESTLVIPEAKIDEPTVAKDDKKDAPKPTTRLSLEVFSLDSDDDESSVTPARDLLTTPTKKQDVVKHETNTCINLRCKSGGKEPFFLADATTIAYYDSSRKTNAVVCLPCAEFVSNRMQGLLEGIKNMTPLLDLDFKNHNEDFVEISDSDSEEEPDELPVSKEVIGEDGAKLLEEQLADMINVTWDKFKMDARLKETEDTINLELERLEKESKEIDTLLTECQYATDKLRNDFYGTFERKWVEVPSIVIFDTPNMQYESLEEPNLIPPSPTALSTQMETLPAAEGETRQSKRRLPSVTEQQQPAKKPAIPLGYTPLESTTAPMESAPSTPKEKDSKSGFLAFDNISPGKMDDDNADVSVVKLSAESAPDWLPPTGEVVRTPIRVGMAVYAMRNAFGSWMKAKIVDFQPKTISSQFTLCRVKFEHKVKNPCKQLPARCLAYDDPAEFRMTIGTRVIALFKDDSNSNKVGSYYSGVVAEVPNPVNNYRYLVFFDDGYAQYVQHSHTRLVCECSPLVWEEVHPFSREFVRQYLRAYPERPMVRLHAGQSLKTEWNGKWWVSRVIKVDASLVQVHFEEDDRTEWIYRGSTRLAPLYLELQAAERHRARPLPRSTSNKAQPKANMPYVEYTRSDEQGNEKPVEQTPPPPQNEEGRRQRAVAKKSTASAVQAVVSQAPSVDTVTSRVVYYTPKNAVKPLKMVAHTCGPKCRRTDVLALKDLRTYNPLAKPLLSGWERQIVRYKGFKQVMYRAPCGRRVRNLRELHLYLRLVQSDMSVDLFDFGPNTHCLAEFVLNKCIVSKKDLSHGKENVPVPCVNYYDDSLPEFCLYNTERTPTEGVPLNTDPEFLCGCDCTDDCEDKTKCACWQLTLEGARTIGYDADDVVGYVYRRLPEPLPSGIYECNSRCKCKNTCLNRVAQHPLQLKLQVFKTLNRGWGIRALNDVPKGSFLCVYAGNLLTDATANLDGLNEGDEYLAELDYIEVVEQMKEGYEEDIPEADKELDMKCSPKKESGEESASSDEDSVQNEEDADFSPAPFGLEEFGTQEFKKRLRKRDRKKNNVNTDKKEGEDDCITISDDEEVREPSRFMAQAGIGANEFVPKYRSVRAHFGKDEACYIMDAKVQGNIGRYLNHSCTPNVFVQNVFVDTHDPRFPWVAFFALSHIRAGTELTWNYNYDVGSVPGKVLYCYCGATNCRGRLL